MNPYHEQGNSCPERGVFLHIELKHPVDKNLVISKWVFYAAWLCVK